PSRYPTLGMRARHHQHHAILVDRGATQDVGLGAALDQDRMMLVVARSHPEIPMTRAGNLDIRALRWIIREGGSGTREALEDFALSQGVPPAELQIFLVLPSNEAVRQAVEAGAGATIISELVVARSL
ncbi:hypothetical protein EN811_27335, partial [bacterium M00.F.Ca.ET.168.01.1.1]